MNIFILPICLRSNHDDKLKGEKSYLKGRSVRNQRIESYWGQLRKHTGDFYIQLFKCMQENGLFDGSQLHLRCLQYCFGPMITADLKMAMDLWNEHKMRKQAARNNVAGKPYTLYHLPKNRNARDFRKEIDVDVVQTLINRMTEVPQLIDPLFKELVGILLPNHQTPSSPEDGVQLYKEILEAISIHQNQ